MYFIVVRKTKAVRGTDIMAARKRAIRTVRRGMTSRQWGKERRHHGIEEKVGCERNEHHGSEEKEGSYGRRERNGYHGSEEKEDSETIRRDWTSRKRKPGRWKENNKQQGSERVRSGLNIMAVRKRKGG
jgi:hypothetical protein